ncbi:YhcN/YlaJ family sporulation lipoprotein [Cohnella nanjingensis]|uniref:YhcN/YlaJ family sporulation lipoprotein n=1 Tax=Cohnella nanjingensis TaxID=1387779 RepID=A0A7X0RSU0_9BACL|nr:YhcN/YlaJ family sporulation lipoprotein [Cohnella nanjingensis]MBB6672935.1 YhcN/YlaJ family sporulation lipoprotein [Cohnella nanjingensis]
MYKKFGVVALTMLLVFVGTGCTKHNGLKTNQYKARSTQQSTNANSTHPSFNKKVSEKITKHVMTVKGVKKATVFVHDRDAIVGIDVKDGENTTRVAQNVRNSAEKAESGYKVHVTADKNLHTRIQTIHTQSLAPLDGHPVRNFAEDVRILIRDIGQTATAPFR